MIKKILLISSLFLISSCLQRLENRGYSFNLTDYEIKKGVSSKKTISRNMGSPTLVSYINDKENWIYFEEEIEKFLFFKPKVLKRDIILVTFNKNNVVRSLNKYDLSDENDINFNYHITKFKETKEGFFSGLFGNIGQISPQ